MVNGTRLQAEEAQDRAAEVLRPMGLRLSETKTKIVHIDEGFDFLGFRIRRGLNRGDGKRHIYTYPSKKAVLAITSKVRARTRGNTNLSLSDLLRQLNPMLRGWANYFRHGVSYATFSYVDNFTWRRVVCWLRRKHDRRNWKWLMSHYLPDWRPTEGGKALFNPRTVKVTRYRYRGYRIPTPWAEVSKA